MCFPTWMSTAMPIRVSSAPTSHSSFWRCAFTKSPSSSMVVFKYFNYCLVLEKLSSMSFRCHSAWCCRRRVSRHPYLLPSSLTLTLESTPSSPLYVCIIHEVFFHFYPDARSLNGCHIVWPISDTRIQKSTRVFWLGGSCTDIQWVRQMNGYKFIHSWRRESDADGMNTRTMPMSDLEQTRTAPTPPRQQRKNIRKSTTQRTL